MPIKKRGRPVRARKNPKARPGQYDSEIEKLVKVGVERFILQDATMYDFMKTIRRAATEGAISAHPLNSTAFSKIVQEAVRKRKTRQRKKFLQQKRKKHA